MTYNGENHFVRLINQVYKTGVKVTKKRMKKYNGFVNRMPNLKKWSLTVTPGYSG